MLTEYFSETGCFVMNEFCVVNLSKRMASFLLFLSCFDSIVYCKYISYVLPSFLPINILFSCKNPSVRIITTMIVKSQTAFESLYLWKEKLAILLTIAMSFLFYILPMIYSFNNIVDTPEPECGGKWNNYIDFI